MAAPEPAKGGERVGAKPRAVFPGTREDHHADLKLRSHELAAADGARVRGRELGCAAPEDVGNQRVDVLRAAGLERRIDLLELARPNPHSLSLPRSAIPAWDKQGLFRRGPRESPCLCGAGIMGGPVRTVSGGHGFTGHSVRRRSRDHSRSLRFPAQLGHSQRTAGWSPGGEHDL